MLEKSRGLIAISLIVGLFATINTAILKYPTVADALQIISPLGTMFGVILGGVAGFYFNAKAVDAATTGAEQANADADLVVEAAQELGAGVDELNEQLDKLAIQTDELTPNLSEFEDLRAKLNNKVLKVRSIAKARKK